MFQQKTKPRCHGRSTSLPNLRWRSGPWALRIPCRGRRGDTKSWCRRRCRSHRSWDFPKWRGPKARWAPDRKEKTKIITQHFEWQFLLLDNCWGFKAKKAKEKTMQLSGTCFQVEVLCSLICTTGTCAVARGALWVKKPRMAQSLPTTKPALEVTAVGSRQIVSTGACMGTIGLAEGLLALEIS